jgi:hypothetical protein
MMVSTSPLHGFACNWLAWRACARITLRIWFWPNNFQSFTHKKTRQLLCFLISFWFPSNCGSATKWLNLRCHQKYQILRSNIPEASAYFFNDLVRPVPRPCKCVPPSWCWYYLRKRKYSHNLYCKCNLNWNFTFSWSIEITCAIIAHGSRHK